MAGGGESGSAEREAVVFPASGARTSFSEWFIRRPIGTSLLAIGTILLGTLAFWRLPVASLPSVDFPVIFISTGYPGAGAVTMAGSVAAPIERRVGKIAGVRAMSSINALGSTLLFVTFELGRNMDHAARDVQSALNSAAADLPAGLPNVPTFRKANPDSVPILILSLTSSLLNAGSLFDVADSVLVERLSQIDGVAAVTLSGADQPAIRVTADPQRLAGLGLSLDDLRSSVVNANALSPIGAIDGAVYGRALATSGQLQTLADYRNLVVKSTAAGTVLLGDVADVELGSRNDRSEATLDGKPAVLIAITKAPGANVIKVVDRINQLLPTLDRFLPATVELSTFHDRAVSIRASVDDMLVTIAASIVLVVFVVFVFLHRLASIIAAAATLPLALAGTCIAMWLAGFSLDTISLMALATAVGFVIDDAVVVIENIERVRMSRGPLQAAIIGARQVWFTLLSISASLLSAFIPLLWLGGVLGRLFREFSVTLAFAVGVSTVASLTVTPMLCAVVPQRSTPSSSVLSRVASRSGAACRCLHLRLLTLSLRYKPAAAACLLLTIALNVYLFIEIPKGTFPTEESNLLLGTTEAASTISFKALSDLQRRVVAIITKDPAVLQVGSSLGASGGRTPPANQGRLFVTLRPVAERNGLSAAAVISRLRKSLASIVGITTYLQQLQELKSSGPAAKSPLQITLTDANDSELLTSFQIIRNRMRQLASIIDVSDDHGSAGLQANLHVHRLEASRLSVTMAGVDNALNNSFSQREISTIYAPRNQYRVVLSATPAKQEDPKNILDLYVPAGVTPVQSSTISGATIEAGLSAASQLKATQTSSLSVAPSAQVRLATIADMDIGSAPLSVNHQNGRPEITISFAAADGFSDEQAMRSVLSAIDDLHPPQGLHDQAGGVAEELDEGSGSQVVLILLALASIYIVLGVLYESLVHPVTILSTLPAAAMGALLALQVTGAKLDRIALIGILLTVSIAKKNGIMLVDFALQARRERSLDAVTAVKEAAIDRFRPILMTTMASVLGGVPLLVASGPGSALRHPFGLTIIGGLLVAQILTLYTTPVVFCYVDAADLALGRKLAEWRGESLVVAGHDSKTSIISTEETDQDRPMP